ncbi:unnamed protein product [Arabidopsis arenosa]|uniref:F-box associated beta-propeller type 3 domain-containing protein n=1 Tax=Arabidopsis arenosa TaxID=38785 RepID=A0A8S1ZI74_ARAAE|nr:unnamed protein product [Arabidopsis arenosa]
MLWIRYDPVGDHFKVFDLVTSPDQFLGFLVHEVITLGRGGRGETPNQVTTAPYYPVTNNGFSINGFLYYAAWAQRMRMDPVIVCFDVRYESLSFITAPRDVVAWESDSVLIEYKGKLASIVRDPLSFSSFDLWILEDVKKHDWSKQTFELPFPLVNRMTSPGTNKAGEIIFAPMFLPYDVEQPFFVFYYNVERKDIRRVRLQGIADNKEFRHRYGLIVAAHMSVSISPEHIESIASL